MTPLLFLHIVSVSVWLGCILVEAVYEHSIDASPAMRRFVSALHWTTDKWIEIPAFLGVLVTGGLMAAHVPVTPLLSVKIGFGLLAITANAVCVGLVLRRLRHAETGNFTAWEAADHRQHKIGAVVLLALLVALGIGGYRLAAG